MTFQNQPAGLPGPSASGGPSGLPGAVQVQPTAAASSAFLVQAFVWMFAGLLVTAAVAALLQTSQTVYDFAANNFLLVIIAQLVLVLAISAGIRRFSATAALGLFFVYAASLGITVGVIVALYAGASVVSAFLSSAAMFGGAALYGATTRRSLAGVGGMLVMGIIGLIVASIVNVFLGSGIVGLIISIIGVVIFTALTAFDVQRIQAGGLIAQTGSVEKAAVIGALRLYLDFINLFLFMLRILGGAGGRR